MTQGAEKKRTGMSDMAQSDAIQSDAMQSPRVSGTCGNLNEAGVMPGAVELALDGAAENGVRDFEDWIVGLIGVAAVGHAPIAAHLPLANPERPKPA